ncbi:hypothetical protein NKI34_32525 [Mesorhizobium sp. M0700]|uniref:DUF6894 family protein n=1 Tax=unclassified Mesorhizobium TaxID=325217 RepID=UPI0033350091
MRRYFFDSGDAEHLVQDDMGVECEGIAAARQAAVDGLIDLAREALGGSEQQQLLVDIRDESGRKILRLSLILKIEKLELSASR